MRGLLVVVAVGALARGAYAAPNALDKPAFTATPQELLGAAKGTAAGTNDIVVLREDNDVSYDDRGRATVTWRSVFYVATAAGADDWDMMSATWLPAYQDKPTLRARVIDASGRSQDLDATRITESSDPDRRIAPNDRHYLEAKLPRLAAGSIVEQQVITVDREPLVGGGAATMLDYASASRSLAIRLSSPKKLRTIAHGMAFKPKIESKGGRQIQTFVGGPLQERTRYEFSTPPDVRLYPSVIATPVASWQAIAREYRALVDKRIGEGTITLPSDIPKGGTSDTVRALHAWLHRQVKYEAVDLYDTAPIPSTPAETLKRGSGDAKDMATLFVAALRASGVKANLALVRRGPGWDLDRDVPGFNFFDHVLVRAQIGKTELWIDPSARTTAPGRMPQFCEGRLALVISDGTNALVPTPVSKPGDNTVREVRTYELAEAGGAKLTEVTTRTGTLDADQRMWAREVSNDDMKRQLSSSIADQHRGELVSYSASNADDLAKPFETTIVVKDSIRAYADREAIDIYLFPNEALEHVPYDLRTVSRDPTPRKYDYMVSPPHVHEIENRFVVPVGYSMPSPAPERVRELGPLKLVERQRVDGRQLVVSYRFETTKTRLTPAEVTKIQQAISALNKEQAEHIVVEHTAIALADKGKYKEALTEVNRLIKLHPKEAVHQQQLAQVLQKAGACEPARRAARKATELEPKSADAYVVLAYVLQHDSMCKWVGYDHDHAGARVALEKAHKLDPKHIGAAHDLAVLLEHDARGRRFEAGADLRGAIKAWKAARALDDTDDRAFAMVSALLWSGDGAEAEKVLRAMAPSERRDQLLTAASAMAGGADAALRTATALGSSTRTKNLSSAGGLMFLMRRYDVMRALFAESRQPSGNPAWDQAMQRLTRSDKPFKPTKTAKDIVLAAVLGEALERPNAAAFWDAKTREETRRSEMMGRAFKRIELMTDGLLEDVLRSSLQLGVDGDNGLWRVEIDSFGAKETFYVASDRGAPKIVGSPGALEGVGRHVLRLVAKKDDKGAARLLDWLAKDLAPLRTVHTHRLAQLWGANLPRTLKDIEVAGAMLAAETDPVRATKILTACKPSTKDGQFVCDWALSEVYRDTKRWTELLDHTRAWLGRATSTPVLPTIAQAYALAHLGKFDEADQLLAAAIAKDADNRGLLSTHADVAVARGRLREAIRRLDALMKATSPEPNDLNNTAWLELIDGTDVKGAALPMARRAVQAAPKEPHAANTLAAVAAEVGELQEANQQLAISLEGKDKAKPDDADLYVHARVLEQLGYVDDAIAIYRKIKPDTNGFTFTPDVDVLVAKRLKALGVTK